FFRDQGYGFLIPSYRYNAGHGGIPGEEQLIRDGQAVLNWLRSKGHDDDQFVLYGESLGSGVAISLAQNNVGRAVILEGPYSSITDVAAEVYWFLPVRALIKDEFDSKSYIGNLIPPVLILHGARDKTIPVKFAQKLHSHGNPHKDRIIVYPDGEHTGLYAHGADRDVAAFLSVTSIGN
ncbi:MAG: alpha/beta hydrolase, partial [Alphaproteobacteria bacterium]|nr:alpha/beta hydrolase [Alphaproteobacteria bacterium]